MSYAEADAPKNGLLETRSSSSSSSACVDPTLPSSLSFSEATPEDFMSLLKPRVMSLVVFTALVGLVIAPQTVHPFIGFVSLLLIAVGAGASGALNMWYDADIDAVMLRTRGRPVPRGRILPAEALGFGLSLSVASVLLLGLVANWAAAALLAFTIFFYAVVYTMWLKRSTPQNIVIGGLAGAFPPVIGWMVATGAPSWESVALCALIFIWTPPHFWALALYKKADYERAQIPMLPVVAGELSTRRHIFAYTLLLVPVGLLPVVMGFGGTLYFATSALLGLGMLWLAFRVRFAQAQDDVYQAAKHLFGFSILYLFALFAVLLVEHLLGGRL